ncbi:MAG: PilZ domain-containing protein [Thermodesulfobacteriota bacterium]
MMNYSNYYSDRRKYPRLLMDLPLEYRVTDIPHAHGGLVVNISEAGLLIHSVKNIPVGTKLNIAVLFPKGFELANFDLLAEIIRKDIYWEEDWEGYEYGLKFIRILEEDLWKLKRVLSGRFTLGEISPNQ